MSRHLTIVTVTLEDRPGGGLRVFSEAISVARRQSAKSLELRAATDLAELWRAQERYDEVRDLIGPIYSWFTEGTDTADLRRARDTQIAAD